MDDGPDKMHALDIAARSLRIKIPARGKIYSCNQANIADAWLVRPCHKDSARACHEAENKSMCQDAMFLGGMALHCNLDNLAPIR